MVRLKDPRLYKRFSDQHGSLLDFHVFLGIVPRLGIQLLFHFVELGFVNCLQPTLYANIRKIFVSSFGVITFSLIIRA